MSETATAQESESRRKVREMTAAGIKPRQISAALGISTQMVYRHLTKLREAGQLPKT